MALPTKIITETSARYHWVDQMQLIISTSIKIKQISDGFNGIVYSFANNKDRRDRSKLEIPNYTANQQFWTTYETYNRYP